MDEKRCYGCMRMTSAEDVCEHCGYDLQSNNASHQLSAGTVLREQYLIGRVLGQGGFGITYLGWDLYLDLPVAIKEYYPSGVVMRDTEVSMEVVSYSGEVGVRFRNNKERFLREAKMLARFGDVREIVQIKNFFLANNTAYIVMEYVQGITLKEYVQRNGGKLSVAETFDILCPVMEALGKVHKAGLVHRDISPDNIMMLPTGGAKLLDFGAVRDLGNSESASTEAILKPGYAPIEQYQRKGNLGPWTDVYGLCATICYCITGKIPTEAPERLLGDEELNIRESVSELTQAQENVLRHGMELRVEKRIASTEELMAQLFAQPEPEPIPDPQPTPDPNPVLSLQPKKKKWHQDWRSWAAIGAAAALVVCVIGLGGLLPGDKEEPVSTEPSAAPEEITAPTATPDVPAEPKQSSDAAQQSGHISYEIQTGQCGDNVFYEFDEATGRLSILGSGPMYDYDPWGPSAGWSPFFISNLKSVTIGEGVTSIGNWAFRGIAGTANLKEVTLPQSLETIGYGAFQNTSIESITIPDSVYEIGGEAFSNCKNLKSFEWPENVKIVPFGIFKDSNLEEITIPDGVERIDDCAFENTKLKSIELPESVGWVCTYTFAHCPELTDVTVGRRTILSFDLHAKVFSDENGETPENLTIHGYSNTSTEIYAKHFDINFDEIGACGWDREGQCGDSVYFKLSIDGHFLYIYGRGKMWDFDSEYRFITPETQAMPKVPWEEFKDDICALYIEEDMTYIEGYDPGDCVTHIGEYAFAGCHNLIDIYLGGVHTICKNAFLLSGVDELIDNGNLRTIEKMAFSSCNALYHVELQDGFESLAGAVFNDCDNLNQVHLPGDVKIEDEDGVTPFNAATMSMPSKLVIYSDANSAMHEFANKYEIPFLTR